MDQVSLTKFNNIIDKELHDLTGDDVLFLKARRSYLTVEQVAKFQAVLNEVKKEEVVEETTTPATEATQYFDNGEPEAYTPNDFNHQDTNNSF